MKLSIIIPVYNEAITVKKILEQVIAIKLKKIIKEIIVVDDGSTDGTQNILKKIRNDIDQLLLSTHQLGKGAALKKGFQKATGDFILIQDADLEYTPRNYVTLLSPLENKKYEVVFGSRYLKKNQRNQLFSLGNKCITFLFNIFYKTHLSDISTGYKLFPKKVVAKLIQISDTDFAFDVLRLTQLLVTQGYKIVEVPIDYFPRKIQMGKKLKLSDGFKIGALLVYDGMRLWTQKLNFLK